MCVNGGYICVCVCVYMCECMWRLEDHFQQSVFFHPVSLGDWIWFLRFGGKLLYLVSHWATSRYILVGGWGRDWQLMSLTQRSGVKARTIPGSVNPVWCTELWACPSHVWRSIREQLPESSETPTLQSSVSLCLSFFTKRCWFYFMCMHVLPEWTSVHSMYHIPVEARKDVRSSGTEFIDGYVLPRWF